MSSPAPASHEPRTAREYATQSSHAPEGTEVPVVYITAAALLTLVILTLLGVGLLTRLFAARLPSAADSLQQWESPAPQLPGQPAAGFVRRRLEQRADALLSGYAWLSEEHEAARIPIDRAMRLIAQDASLIGPVNGPPPVDQMQPQPEQSPVEEQSP